MSERRSRRSLAAAGAVEPKHEHEHEHEQQEQEPVIVKEENDNEYQEDEDDAEEEEDDDDDDEEVELSPEEEKEIVAPPPKRRRGRPPKKRPVVETTVEDDDDLEDDENEHETRSNSNRHHVDSDSSTPRAKNKRGRKPAVAPEGTLRSDAGRVLTVVDDEYNVSSDEEGDTKIDENGALKGGREYRVRTFKVKGKGDKLYMLSTEPARCMGFRDSYLLFQKHRTLYKVVVDHDEKFDLIEREIIPHSYKGRVIGLVTARSVFREFGAKIVVGGKNITDDYYANKIRQLGTVEEGTLAEPDDVLPAKGQPYNKNQFVAWHGASNVYHQGTTHHQPAAVPAFESLELKTMKALKHNTLMSEDNWMLQHAAAIREVDTLLLQNRYALARGIRDPYTGTTFVPGVTQPTHVEYTKIVNPDIDNSGKRRKLTFETVMSLPHMATKTGLKDVPLEVFADSVDEETKRAILQQQEYERTLV
ncbi:CYFA0S28e00166g1_1 [Cyberlindnera fabianii]|uniref:CYFA0S28e00166g1_1 n=1 Tax=Cyberlindnera fabianii TaxID=36022 RepID=A0A061BAV2_CYBFA|nr:CYFA0S28e00166g1_1 [Cyberlindnera fabianii]